jgi:fission process protein 1
MAHKYANSSQLGLAVVPALPYLFDKPIEHAVEWTFHKGFELIGGPEAVQGQKPAMGLINLVKAAKKEEWEKKREEKKEKKKEKEL